MAARQEQTLQIWLAIVIFLLVAASVAAYFGWKQSGTERQRGAELQNQLNSERQAKSTFQSENENLREWVGFQPNEAIDAVKNARDADVKAYGMGLAEGDQGYRNMLRHFVEQELKRTAAAEAAAAQQYRELDARYKAVEREKDEQIAKINEARERAETESANQRNDFAAYRAKLEAEKSNLMTSVDSQRQAYEAQIAEREATVSKLQEEVAKLQKTVEIQLVNQKPPAGRFEVADGQIAWANQSGTVWINLGSADAVRPLVTFSIYDADAHDIERDKPKATIEVTMVTQAHLSEARVTSDDPKNPILKGDLVYNPIWRRGQPLHFALTGIVDIDGDGVSDMQLVRDLVTLNGGAVDAYIDDEGKVQGSMTVNTRFLVRGKFPEGVLFVNHQESWQTMNQDAVKLGIQTLDIDQLLDQLGYHPASRTVKLGAGATARDFPARPLGDTDQRGSILPDRFRPRTPQAATIDK